jgi:hypothetical protein
MMRRHALKQIDDILQRARARARLSSAREDSNASNGVFEALGLFVADGFSSRSEAF